MAAWQFTLSATDANRFALRICRQIQRRPKVLVFQWCYHGSVDETVAALDAAGAVRPKPGNVGPQVDPAVTTAWPSSTTSTPSGARSRAGTSPACWPSRRSRTSASCCRSRASSRASRTPARDRDAARLRRDAHDLRRAGRLRGGLGPAARHRHDRQVAGRRRAGRRLRRVGGGARPHRWPTRRATTSTGAASAARSPATRCRWRPRGRRSQQVLTPDAFTRMEATCDPLPRGRGGGLRPPRAPWSIVQLGARAEYHFTPRSPRTGSEAHAAIDHLLDDFVHLLLLNRGVMLRRSTTWR